MCQTKMHALASHTPDPSHEVRLIIQIDYERAAIRVSS
jgi:hypothetical protein